MPEQPNFFADNFDRLLGFHRLTARKASSLLGISAATLSYWLNGKREPDTGSLFRIRIYFQVEPWRMMMMPARDFVTTLADLRRFDAVEERISSGTTFADLVREAQQRVMKAGSSEAMSRLDDALAMIEMLVPDEEPEPQAPRRRSSARRLQAVPSAPARMSELLDAIVADAAAIAQRDEIPRQHGDNHELAQAILERFGRQDALSLEMALGDALRPAVHDQPSGEAEGLDVGRRSRSRRGSMKRPAARGEVEA